MSAPLPTGLRLGLVIFSLCLHAGCQSLNLNVAQLVNRVPRDSVRNPVTEIVCLWEPAEGTGLDKLPSRGFAGQVLFITPRDKDPVQVDGKVSIYVFDDQGTPEEQKNPIHQFVFDAKSWNGLLRQTNLGAAYQLFIPYTRPGMHQAECSLRVCYESTEGRQTYSTFAKVLLTGISKPTPAATEPSPTDDIARLSPATAVQLKTAIPDNAVVPAAYTFENSAKSDASIQQLQARFDRVLEDGAVADASPRPQVQPEATTTGRFRLKPVPAASEPEDGP